MPVEDAQEDEGVFNIFASDPEQETAPQTEAEDMAEVEVED